MKNTLPPNFLKTYEKSMPREIKHIPLNSGFLELKYNENRDISSVHFIKQKGGEAVGAGLEWSRSSDENVEVTFITKMGLSGTCWSNGEAYQGTTLETEDAEKFTTPNRKVDLETWVDECLEKMIHPQI